MMENSEQLLLRLENKKDRLYSLYESLKQLCILIYMGVTKPDQ